MSIGTLFQQALPLGRTRPLDDIGRQRVVALLLAGRNEAAVRAYRESTRASQRAAEADVERMRSRLASPSA